RRRGRARRTEPGDRTGGRGVGDAVARGGPGGVQDTDAPVLPRQAGGIQDPGEGAGGVVAALDALQEDPPGDASRRRGPPVKPLFRQALKSAIDAVCLVLVVPAAAMCAAEAKYSPRAEMLFTAWAQTFALVPGLAGVFVRRAFYRLTLEQCDR